MNFQSRRSVLFGILLSVALLVLLTGAALAQDSPQTGTTSEVTPDEVNKVARELWCPLCSGVRLDACELKACDQMKEIIAVKLAEGEDVESIKQYFVGQYGPQVLGEPPREGLNWLAWILPFLALAIGAVFLWRQMNRMMRPVAQDVGAAQPDESDSDMAMSPSERNARSEYDRRLDEELTKHG